MAWIFLKTGVYSVVRKGREHDLTVRSRAAADLDRLRSRYAPALGATVANAGTDYAFRARISPDHFAAAMATAMLDVDYGNFKGVVAQTLGWKRERVLHDIWQILADAPGDDEHEGRMEPLLPTVPRARRRRGGR